MGVNSSDRYQAGWVSHAPPSLAGRLPPSSAEQPARPITESRCRRAWVLAAVGLFALQTPAVARDLDEIPFWRANEGWWVSENTYFAPSLDYNVRNYSSLVRIEVDARRVVETEYKFWPPGRMAAQAGRGLSREGEGVEQVTVKTFERTDDEGTARLISMEPAMALPGKVTTVRVTGADTAQQIVRDPSEPFDHYRMFISMPTPERRYLISYGLVSVAGAGAEPGSLRGLSTFHGRRIQQSDFERLRADMRRKYAVRVIVTAGPDHRPKPQRLD